MTMRDQIRALETENAALKAEVTALRAHVCVPAQPVCTCNGTATAGLIGCPVHGLQYRGGGSWLGAAPGAAGVGQSVIMNTAAANPLPVSYQTQVAANACAGPPITHWIMPS